MQTARQMKDSSTYSCVLKPSASVSGEHVATTSTRDNPLICCTSCWREERDKSGGEEDGH